jgi:coenzyme F420-dependent glucose-6-phosphate dehydrogenase
MRALWAGEVVGDQPRGSDCRIRIHEAKLYTRPEEPPQIIGAAITPETAEWVAGWADGLITIGRPHDELKEVVDAFRSGGGRGKPMLLQSQVAYNADADEARRQAFEQWRTNIFPSPVLSTLSMPGHFDEAAELLQPDDLDGHIRISADLEQHSDWIRADIELGFDEIYLHHVGCDQDQFIAAFGEHVLPGFSSD